MPREQIQVYLIPKHALFSCAGQLFTALEGVGRSQSDPRNQRCKSRWKKWHGTHTAFSTKGSFPSPSFPTAAFVSFLLPIPFTLYSWYSYTCLILTILTSVVLFCFSLYSRAFFAQYFKTHHQRILVKSDECTLHRKQDKQPFKAGQPGSGLEIHHLSLQCF